MEVYGLVKRFGRTTAVDGLSMTVAPGEIFGLLGPNGAGKTTTLACLAGLQAPSSGSLRVLGLDPRADAARLRRLVAVQPQQAALFPNLTAAETLRLWGSFYAGCRREAGLLDEVGLTDQRDVRVRHLSGGQRQRLLLATALVSRPELLMLDEASAGLDPNVREQLWTAVRRHSAGGGTVVLTTHSMEEAEALCGRVAIMAAGRIAAEGSPAALVAAHVPWQVVSFHVPGAVDERRMRELSRGGEVWLAPAGGETAVTIRTREAERTVAALFTEPGLAVRDLRMRSGDLGDVFRAVTGTVLHPAEES